MYAGFNVKISEEFFIGKTKYYEELGRRHI